MNDIVIVGHQPQYMPYLGILNKISKADIYIIVDHVQFIKKSFLNRTYIKLNDKAHLLTIPVLTKGKYSAPICEIEINYEINWIKKHIKTIYYAYGKAPFFKKYFETIENIFNKSYQKLSDFTSDLLIFFIREFELVNDIKFSSDMQLKMHKTELLVELTKAVNGNVYISGEGAKAYFDEAIFNKSGFKHYFNHFIHPAYPQCGRNFLEGMSCIDLLFNCGKDGRKYIINREEVSDIPFVNGNLVHDMPI